MRRPAPAWLDPRAVRLTALTAFALLGSLQWVRYVQGASGSRAIAWSLAAAVTGGLLLLARGRPLARAGAVLAGLGLAVGASGLDLTYLEPNHWDELGAGIYRGVEALNTVKLPYGGRESWVLTTLELAGALVCWLAAVLTCGWPDGRGRAGALVLLLVLVAAPTVSIGASSPVALGLALALLTAAFLWLERLARRPGLGLALLVAAVAIVAAPLGSAADREEPWFDYKAFSENLTGADPVTFDWDHEYGPIDWAREGAELFRVDTKVPRYWKAETLDDFDGRLWTYSRDDPGDGVASDLPFSEPRAEWITNFSVTISALRSRQFVGSGTTLSIAKSTEEVEPAVQPGQWVTQSGDELDEGDSYDARAYVPSPSPDELAEATTGGDGRRLGSLEIDVSLSEPRIVRVPGLPAGLESSAATVLFRPFAIGGAPEATYADIDVPAPGRSVMRNSSYARTWRLAQRLKQRSATPYEYVLAVNRYLARPEFRYTERPPALPDGVAPLEGFLFDTRRGYCQQFSGAMALLLRMGGVPARIATGFTPGGQRDSGEWVVRDTDAHSWVEVWFDNIGWVTFDPTPPATPARSQIAALVSEDDGEAAGTSDAASSGGGARDPRPAVPREGSAGTAAAESDSSGGGTPWVLIVLMALLSAAAALLVARAARRSATPEGALAELERALRRAGRAAAPGTTLAELEHRLGASPDGYLGALRAARFSPHPSAPEPGLRRAFRRELAANLGPAGRLRALWALPPRLPHRARPSSSVDRATAS